MSGSCPWSPNLEGGSHGHIRSTRKRTCPQPQKTALWGPDGGLPESRHRPTHGRNPAQFLIQGHGPDAGATKPYKHSPCANKTGLTCPTWLTRVLTLGHVNGESTQGNRPSILSSENGWFAPTPTASLPTGAHLTLPVACSCHQTNGAELVERRVTCAGLFQHLGCVNLFVFSICLWRRPPVAPHCKSKLRHVGQSKSPHCHLERIGVGRHPDSFVTNTELRAPGFTVCRACWLGAVSKARPCEISRA